MKANAVPFLGIFETKMRLEVPLFQRQYVWNSDDQWEPLWEDISRKFTDYVEGRRNTPVHFLGAMVLDQKQTPTTHVEKRQVIDGQQRLTTLQIFLAALRDFCREHECEELAKEYDAYTLNKGIMKEPEVEKYKVWPTQVDRRQFRDVIDSGSKIELENKNPLVREKYSRRPNPRPRMVEAYLFFHENISEYFIGTESDPPPAGDQPLAFRLEECLQALKNALQVVVIDLDQDDDAQVIFETLNARGAPLLPADLLRNFIFLRAARSGEPQEELYDQYWRRFDDDYWRQEIRQGRLNRPRSDLYMQHFLTSHQMREIPIKNLFVEYKYWIEKERPFSTIRDELETIARQGDDFRRIISPEKDYFLFPLATFLNHYDVSTAYPLLLFLLEAGLPVEEWDEISTILESYLVRRAVCGLTAKNYNRNFLALLRYLDRESPTAENIRSYLSGLHGDSGEWPRDQLFRDAWEGRHVYQTLNNPKVVHIFRRLNETYLNSKFEHISIHDPLTVEHILPQNWIEHWLLPDGSRGLDWWESLSAETEDKIAQASIHRDRLLQTFGNLTIITQPLNSAASNSAWGVKKTELRSSLLPINQELHEYESWDEEAIQRRSGELFERAVQIWPAPSRN